jgi:hypothetical protein
VALDSTVLRAGGGVWHKKDREAGVVPHTSIDTEAGWTKSGWHGWVYGWKLHLATTVAGVWIPLSARLTPANASDNRIAPLLIEELPGRSQARFVLGDTHYNAPNVRAACVQSDRFLMASGRRGPYPHQDAGVEVRRIFHRLRHAAIENTGEHFKKPSSRRMVRYPPKGELTPRASLWGQYSSTNLRCSTATNRTWTPTAG